MNKSRACRHIPAVINFTLLFHPFGQQLGAEIDAKSKLTLFDD